MATWKWRINPRNRRRNSLGVYLAVLSLTIVLCLAIPGWQRVMAKSIVCRTTQAACVAQAQAAIASRNHTEAKKTLTALETDFPLTAAERWWVLRSLADVDAENAGKNLQQALEIARNLPADPGNFVSNTQSAIAQLCVRQAVFSLRFSAPKDSWSARSEYLQGPAAATRPRCPDPVNVETPATSPEYGLKQVLQDGLDQFNQSIQSLVPGVPVDLTQPPMTAIAMPQARIAMLQARLEQIRLLVKYTPQFYSFLADAYTQLHQDLKDGSNQKYDYNRELLKLTKAVQQSSKEFSQNLAALILPMREALQVAPADPLNATAWGQAQAHFAESLRQFQSLSSSFEKADAALQQLITLAQRPPFQDSETVAFSADLLKSLPPHLLATPTQKALFSAQQVAAYGKEREQLLRSATQQTEPTVRYQALGSLVVLLEQEQRYAEIEPLLTPQALLKAMQQDCPPELSGPLYGYYARSLKRQGDRLTATGNRDEAMAQYRAAKTASDLAIARIEAVRGDLVSAPAEGQYTYRNSIDIFYRDNIDLELRQSSDRVDANDPKQKELEQQSLKRVLGRVEALKVAEIHNYFREPCLAGKSIFLDALIDKASPDTALIYPIVLDNRIEIIAKLPNQTTLQRVESPVDRKTLLATVKALQQQIDDRQNNIQEPAGQLYDWLVRPLHLSMPAPTTPGSLTKAQVKSGPNHPITLVFILDTALQNVPMAALYDKDNGQYLIEQVAIAISPGLALFEPKPSPQLNALFAGFTSLPTPEISTNLQSEDLSGPANELNILINLGVVKKDVLKRLHLPKSPDGLIGKDFTPKNFSKALNLAPFNVVHLSTHAEFHPYSQDTHIKMRGENSPETNVNINEFRTLIQSRDRQREEPIELLVLSACDTAKDDQAILGLAGIALQSGARSTFAALWTADDTKTTAVVAQFYTALLQEQTTKAEALKIAQSSLIKDNPAYIWAPYVLVGNWL